MSDRPITLEQQIAALEEALKLPVPAATRAQIEQDLGVLRERRGAIHGTTNVSAPLQGNAIGVNLGLVQQFGTAPQAPASQEAAEASQEDIEDQRALLSAHRRTLMIYLKQKAQLSSAHTPPSVEHGIREARKAIRHCKAALRGWGEVVDDHPDDEAALP